MFNRAGVPEQAPELISSNATVLEIRERLKPTARQANSGIISNSNNAQHSG